jgi:hypothetical protein
MKVFKLILGLALFAGLVALVQLADTPLDSPSALFQRLPDVSPRRATESGSSFESLAGSTVADSVLYGDLAQQARQGAFDAGMDDWNSLRPMATVFPPADGAITLAKAARQAGAINPSLAKQLEQIVALIQSDPKSPLAVEKFKENVMPMFELAKQCRSWDEFQIILRQADSPDQLKVLTKMAATPSGAQHLSAILAVAAQNRAVASACLDYILHQGPKGLDTLYAAIGKGADGLRFVTSHPGFEPTRAAKSSRLQEAYQSLRYRYGAGVSAAKYLLIAILCGLLVLVVVPGRYLEKLVTRPGSPVPAPTAIHYLLSALAVGVVLAGLAYLLSLAVRPAVPTLAMATGAGGEPLAQAAGDSAFLSGTVVLLSLAIHAVVWFYVRGKIRQVEDDETSTPLLRLKRLENLDVFLDLPLFTGLALTVCAFILITLNAGMSRHFAYTATVVGILSSVSLRIRYQYPLKERLIHEVR